VKRILVNDNGEVSKSAKFATSLLKKVEFEIVVTYGQEFLDDCKIGIDLSTDHARDDIMFRLRSFVWGERVDEIGIKHPADWIEAFKERWFPKWILKRRPVEYTRYVSNDMATYPNFRPSLRDQECLIRTMPFTKRDRNEPFPIEEAQHDRP